MIQKDFFFSGLCRGPGIPSKFGTMVELRERINNVVAFVTPRMLENTWREIEYRLDILLSIKRAHIEKY
jgi:hypothetical protein